MKYVASFIGFVSFVLVVATQSSEAQLLPKAANRQDSAHSNEKRARDDFGAYMGVSVDSARVLLKLLGPVQESKKGNTIVLHATNDSDTADRSQGSTVDATAVCGPHGVEEMILHYFFCAEEFADVLELSAGGPNDIDLPTMTVHGSLDTARRSLTLHFRSK